MKFFSFLITHKYLLSIIIIAVIFLFIYSWLPLQSENFFTSPDENANYFFASQFAENTSLKYSIPENIELNDMLRPRSAASIDGSLVPGSFLGIIIIYGIIGKIFSIDVIKCLTPVFAVIGILFFYLLIKEIFREKIALISTIFLAVLPPFWLYTSRSMFHNVLFISLLIMGLYFLTKSLKENNKSNYHFLLSGLFIGLSLLTRTSEIIWVGAVIAVVLIVSHNKINFKKLVFFLIPLVLILISILFLNNYLYGSPWSFSYSRELVGSSGITSTGDLLFAKLQKLFLPFGFDWQQINHAIYFYLILFFPLFAILWLGSLAMVLKNIITKYFKKIFGELDKYYQSINNMQLLYSIMYIGISAWLILYYGSFEFTEYFDESRPLLGSSYIRYWLPIYIFGLPLMAKLILNLSELFMSKIVKNIFIYGIVICFIITSINTVLMDPLYGLVKTKDDLQSAREINKKVTSVTKNNDIIISGFYDKVFFPDRNVVVNISGNNTEILQKYLQLKKLGNVYLYYSPFDENTNKLFDSFSVIELIKLNKVNLQLPADQALYLLQ